MPNKARSWRLGLASLVLVIAAAGFGPSGPGAGVSEEQLAYSKQMFGEGQKAMDSGNFAEALAKFQDGYRYAPHLHVFTFNIASAADALEDCRTAQTYFQMFVDLVPKHPKLKEAKKRLATLEEECQYDPETSTLNTQTQTEDATDAEAPEVGQSDRMSREQREAIRAMNEAISELNLASKTYLAAKARYPKVKQFARAARRKKKHHKKLRKIAVDLGVELRDPGTPEVKLADTSKRACREAESQEKRIAAAMEKVLEAYDTRKAYRVGSKILAAAERRDKLAFDACS